uniref:Uncharacterized protein n=1 Tax=Aegilops tauschii subsp. strangulata TaxID=200361 RepID=A0A453SNK6_AEGTS
FAPPLLDGFFRGGGDNLGVIPQLGGRDSVLWSWMAGRLGGRAVPPPLFRGGLEDAIRRKFVASTLSKVQFLRFIGKY